MSEQEQEQEQKETEEEIEEEEEPQQKESEYEKELKELDIPNSIEYLKKVIGEHNEFEDITKAKLIVILAEKYEEKGFPILEIRQEIAKQLEGYTTSRYVNECMPARFKNPNRIAAGKKIIQDLSKQTREETINEFKAKKEEAVDKLLEDIEEEIDEPTIETPAQLEKEAVVELLIEDHPFVKELQKQIDNLERKLKAFNKEISYTEMLNDVTMVKLDKVRVTQLQNANSKALKEVHIFVDIRTNEATRIVSDRDYKKEQHIPQIKQK